MRTLEEIQKMLDEKVNTLLGQHRGRVDVVELESHPDLESLRAIHIKMSGGCQGCAGAKATLKSLITTHIQEFDKSISLVIDVTNHAIKANAFFKE